MLNVFSLLLLFDGLPGFVLIDELIGFVGQLHDQTHRLQQTQQARHLAEAGLEAAVAAWRRPLEHARAFLDEDIDELEVHLRDHIDRLIAEGLDEEAAFRRATERLGVVFDLEPEYRKVRWVKHRHRRSLWQELIWEGAMLKNYLRVALRNLRRHKGYTFISVAGLAVSIIRFRIASASGPGAS